MKGKILVVGLIALMLTGGLALASCGDKCPGDGTSGGAGKCIVPADLSTGAVKTCSKGCVTTKAMDPANSGEIKCDC